MCYVVCVHVCLYVMCVYVVVVFPLCVFVQTRNSHLHLSTAGHPGCLNGGSCHNGHCHCPYGFTGDRCEIRKCDYLTS